MHLIHPQTLLPILLALTPLSTALSHPNPHPNAHAQPQTQPDILPRNIPDLYNLSDNPHSPHLQDRQIAAGGGVAPTTLAPSQYPVSTTAGSLFTQNGVTSATWKLFVQTFATTALGTWELGPTPGVGVIGLGDIQGTVGGVRENKRSIETDAPKASG
ncbi:uncharacterized protein RSE6_01495 [Rhynchosporium secalis]|uniref:Uncharacterized protein n=1 Tax=Rhynchosporium secalis TaxID=38038 RepID=A0A1E1LXY1_RHYSE|nr:uncharacterized protein RSE6_01495 [Rhynchosporium secalis]